MKTEAEIRGRMESLERDMKTYASVGAGAGPGFIGMLSQYQALQWVLGAAPQEITGPARPSPDSL